MTVSIINDLVPDSERTGLIGALPRVVRPYASLMRLDRPVGTWLLYWPCAWSVALAGVKGEWALFVSVQVVPSIGIAAEAWAQIIGVRVQSADREA